MPCLHIVAVRPLFNPFNPKPSFLNMALAEANAFSCYNENNMYLFSSKHNLEIESYNYYIQSKTNYSCTNIVGEDNSWQAKWLSVG